MRLAHSRCLLALAAGLAPAAALADDPAAPGAPPAEEPAPPAQPDLDAAVDAAVESLAAEEGEITVTATRTGRDPFDLPWGVTIASKEDLQANGSFVAMKALSRRNAAMWYDERTSTTSDPIIRGFSGFNLLTLVDGNTLSTLWGEGGFGADDMYGKLDPEMVERIEVVRGPAAALYGSNALGAVVNVITRNAPVAYPEEGFAGGGRVRLTADSNSDSGGVRLEGWGATPDVRMLVGGSARDFGHVKGGGDLGELEPSDGRERNWDLSAEWRATEQGTLRLTVQDVHRDHVKRYYRPYQDNENDREAVALFWNDETDTSLWDRFEARAYWQEKVDRRRFFDTGKIGEATTETWAGGLTSSKDLGGGHVLTTGVSFELDDGDSPDDEQFTYVYPGPKRRDAPLSTWTDLGVYALDEWRISEDWSLIGSIRADWMSFETDVDSAYQPAVGNPEDDEIDDSTSSVTGGVGAVWRARPDLHVVANWSRGFRQNAPNFGIRQLGDGVLIPNQLLDPTTSDNFEVGAKGRSDGLAWEAFVYKSFISNWQGDLQSTTYQGSSWYDYNQNGVRDANEGVVQQTEGGDAEVYGIELSAELRPHKVISSKIPPHWSVWGSLARNLGNVDATDTSPYEEPLRHVQPTRLLTGIRWDDVDRPSLGLHAELVADFVNAFHDISSDRRESDLAWRDDPQDGTSPLLRDWGGTPGYTVLSLYAGINVADNVRLLVGVENLTDKKYRAAHSRMDAPGIGFVASLEILF